MKGRALRPHGFPGHARIVESLQDSTRDKFIPASQAASKAAKGELRVIDLGNDYPSSYMLKKFGGHHGKAQSQKAPATISS